MKNKFAELLHKESVNSFVASLIAIFFGLLFGVLIIFISFPQGALECFGILLAGGFYKGLDSLSMVFYTATPIMLTGLCIAFAYKCGEFNIGVPGQYLVGSFVAMFIAIRCTFIPAPLTWLAAVIAAGLAGMVWALIPGILKAYRNVNVVISGIMMNYIGLLLVIQGIKSTIYNSEGAESMTVEQSRSLPRTFIDDFFTSDAELRFFVGIIIAVLLCVLAWFIMNKTVFGYELKACGFNKEAAKYAGMNEKRCIIMSIAIAGFFAGVGGALPYLSGAGRKLQIVEKLPAEGFNGIPIALLGFSNPIGCIFAALFIGYLNVGGNYLQSLNVPIEVIDVIVAIIIYFASFTLLIKTILNKKAKSVKGGK